eukprot:NODE_329_length_9526_cov_0.701708.p8 type:complete len:140 gc:universal NODE_329_length_9526_cov_0.701708:3095-3514(+)
MDIDNEYLAYVIKPLQQKRLCEWNGCNKLFESDQTCYEHVKVDHKPKKIHKCCWRTCDHYSHNPNNNLNHVKKHFKLIEGICLSCSTTFKWKFDLKRHLTNFHKGDEMSKQTIKFKGLQLQVTQKRKIVHNSKIAFLLN